jgi:hypothetical protein
MVIQRGTSWALHVIHAIAPTSVRYRTADNDFGITVCPLLTLRGHARVHCECLLSGGKADMGWCSAKCLLLTQSGHPALLYFVIMRRDAGGASLGAVGEIANVSHTFHPSGRFSASNSL